MTVACASHVLVCGKGSTDVLGLFAGCKSIVRTPTNTLVPELEPCEAVPNEGLMATNAFLALRGGIQVYSRLHVRSALHHV